MTQSAELGNVPNASYGITVRQGLNLSDEALATQSAGSSAPPVTFARMPWFDETAGALKMRNGNNTTWQTMTVFATTAPGVGDDSADGVIVGTHWFDATGKKVYICTDASAGAAVWVDISAVGGGTPVTWYDESTSLGQQTKVKFIGAGVGAAVNGDTVEVTIAAQAAPAGSDATVQFNSSSTLAGAAGIKVKSPSNGPGLVNHILHANTYTAGCYFASVDAGAGFWTDSAHNAAFDLALAGAATLKGSLITVANNNEYASTKVYLRNTTGSSINVTIDTSAGHFTEVIGLSNPFAIAGNATKIVYLTARKDGSGNLKKAVEG